MTLSEIKTTVRELEDHINTITTDKNEQVAIISKAQGMTIENEANLTALAIVKNRIIRAA